MDAGLYRGQAHIMEALDLMLESNRTGPWKAL